MQTPSSSQRPLSIRGAGYIILMAGVVCAATACGGGGNVEPAETLTIALAGTGRGTVTGSPGSINCTNANASGAASGTCEADLEAGAEVTLSATAETGSTFAGWSGDGVSCGASTPCAMTVSESRIVTATFEAAPATHTLTVVGGGPGTGSGRVISDPAGIDCTITGGTEAASGCSGSFATGTAIELQVQAGDLVGWGGACSGTACSLVADEERTVIATFSAAAQATQLGFVGQPSAVQVGLPLVPPVQVAVQDAAGQTVVGRTDAITLQIATNPGGGTLGGQVTRNAENGVATFTDLTLDQIGGGYTLRASASGLPDVTSAEFNVTAEAVAQLAFAVQPAAGTVAGAPINPAVQVRIQDASGVVLTGRTDEIIISLRDNPAGGALGGSKTATAVAGVATFSNLTLQKAGTGYTLAAATQNASGATSDPFNVVAGPPRQLVGNSDQSQSAPVSTAVPERPSVRVLDAFNNPVEGVTVTWEVTAGGGSVVASAENPATRPTGPLGTSTVVSWTLGPEVGTGNNELRASVSGTGITGNPVTFTASGTLPAGQGVFSGVLKQTANLGFVSPTVLIADADLTFQNLTTGAEGTTTSKSDGSFVSPPLVGGDPYKISITATDYKAITYQKPNLPADASFSLGELGMVPTATNEGTAGINVTIHLEDNPTERMEVRIDVFSGYYVGETDPSQIEAFFDEDNVETVDGVDVINNSIPLFLDLGDWGVLTVRVSARAQDGPHPGYETQTRFIIIDNPEGIITLDDFRLQPAE